MNKPRKRTEWKTLITLARKYDSGGNPLPGPAVQTTYSNSNKIYYFSHAPGIISEGGIFSPVQYLHDRHIETYTLLLLDAMMGVKAAKTSGMKEVESEIGLFRMALRDTQHVNRTIENLERAAKVILDTKDLGSRPRPQRKEKGRSTLKASIGDAMKAKSRHI